MREATSGNPTDFFYDANGYPYAMKRNGVTYYYITNLQGDVMKLVDGEGNVVASYEYDPYGKILSATGTMAHANPLRYRGYYYDSELEMYYLQSRYYDPNTGRFINADEPSILGIDTGNLLHYNLFAYSWNNPINMADDGGCLPWFIGAAVGGALFDVATYVITSAISGQEITLAGVGKAALTGAIAGVALGAIGKGIKAATTAVKASKTAQKFTSAGIKIMNKSYANKVFKLTGNLAKKYGKGIKFNKYGFPNFSKFAKYTTKINGLTGNYAKDAALANAKFGLKATPKGFTWHHVEDGLTMMLIPTELHQAVRHTGGAALIKSLFR